MNEVPGDEHVWKRRYVLDSISRCPDLKNVTLVEQVDLASIKQSFKIEKKFNLGIGIPIAGVPSAGSINIDYSKIRDIEITLGEGAVKHYIPRGFLKAGYDWCQMNSDEFDRQLFYDDYMAVDQVLYVNKFSLDFQSEIDFSAGFKAQAESINDAKVGVTYHVSKSKTVNVEIDSKTPYLIALGAVQLENVKG